MKGKPLPRIAIVLLVLAAVLLPIQSLMMFMETPQQMEKLSVRTKAVVPTPHRLSDWGCSEKRSNLRATPLLHAAPPSRQCYTAQAGCGDDDHHSLQVELLVHRYLAPLEKSFRGQKNVMDSFPIPESFLS